MRPEVEKLVQTVSKKQGELVPVLPKLFYGDFPSDLIKDACLEYWIRHNFNWTQATVPVLSFRPTVGANFLKTDLPGDMVSAIQTKAFERLYQEHSSEDEQQVEKRIRTFCMTVCGIGKGMELLSQTKPKQFKWQSDEELLLAAIYLTAQVKE